MPVARLMALPLALAVASTTGFALTASPKMALAETDETLQQRIEESGTAYDEAQQRVAELQAKIDANEERIAQIEAELPGKKLAAAESIRAIYKMHQGTNVMYPI